MRHARLHRLARDPLERLRKLRGQGEPEPSRLRGAVSRLLASTDGQIILDWLVAQSYGRTAPGGAPDSALRENEARKRFLDQFLALAEEPSEVSNAPTSQGQRPGQ